MNKKGFTLIELLVVIVILALLMVVSSSIINNTLGNTKTKLMEIEAKKLLKAAYEEYQTKEALGENFVVKNSSLDGEFTYSYGIIGDTISLSLYNKKESISLENSKINIKSGKIELGNVNSNLENSNYEIMYGIKINGKTENDKSLGENGENLFSFNPELIEKLSFASDQSYCWNFGVLKKGLYTISFKKNTNSYPLYVYLYKKDSTDIVWSSQNKLLSSNNWLTTSATGSYLPATFEAINDSTKYAICCALGKHDTKDKAKENFNYGNEYQIEIVKNGESPKTKMKDIIYKEYESNKFIEIMIDDDETSKQRINFSNHAPLRCENDKCDYIDVDNKKIVRIDGKTESISINPLKAQKNSIITVRDNQISYSFNISK